MAHQATGISSAFTATFMLLSLIHILLLLAALRLPFFIEKTEQSSRKLPTANPSVQFGRRTEASANGAPPPTRLGGSA